MPLVVSYIASLNHNLLNTKLIILSAKTMTTIPATANMSALLADAALVGSPPEVMYLSPEIMITTTAVAPATTAIILAIVRTNPFEPIRGFVV